MLQYGMDIDLRFLKIEPASFCPSKVDLIRIKDSFLSVVGFYPKGNSDVGYRRIEVTNTSIGFGVAIRPHVRISQAIIPPPLECIHENVIQERLDENVIQDRLDLKYEGKRSFGSLMVHEAMAGTSSIIQLFAILVSLVPAYY
jgi:hypothetical protein